jgi:hypothetical protein
MPQPNGDVSDHHEHHDELHDVVTDEGAVKAKAAAVKGSSSQAGSGAPGSGGTARRRVHLTSLNEASEVIREVDDVLLQQGQTVHVPVVKGEFTALPAAVQQFIAEYVSLLFTVYPKSNV